MKKQFILIFLVSLQLIVKGQTDLSDKLIKKTEDFILLKMKSDKIVGVSAALVVNDSIIWEKGFGFADLKNQIPMTINTVVNIGSVTKPITALCAMQLDERGLLDINQPITKYLPQFNPITRGENIQSIKVRNLITHSAGLQIDIWKNGDLKTGKYTDVVGFINETFLLYPPGVLNLYSNADYNILGHIIKEVSQIDYPDYVHENIFKPLGMNNSGFYIDSLNNRTKLYDRKMNEVVDYPIRDIASGGIYTNIHDFSLLAKGIINSYNNEKPSILKASTMKKIFTQQNGDAKYVVGINKRGFGWYLFENDSALAVNHTGSAGYAYAHLMIFPKAKAAFMILINTSSGFDLGDYAGYNILDDFHLQISDVFVSPLIKDVKEEINPITLSNESLLKHIGYYSEALSYSKVYIANDTLEIARNDNVEKLIPLSDNEFVPLEIVKGKGKTDIRYFFKDLNRFHVLIQKSKNNEIVLGYKFNSVNPVLLKNKIGNYEHFGYQPEAGDAKFKGVELKLSNDNILILVLETLENKYSIPLDVISDKYATTAGLMSGYGMTVSFTENEKYDIVDFSGITFRKEK